LLVQELGFGILKSPIKLFCDKQAAIHNATNQFFHEWMNHIEVNCHFICEQVQEKTFETPYICSDEQLAYVFTKVLSERVFRNMVSKLTFEDIFTLAWRGSVKTIRMLDRPNPNIVGDLAGCATVVLAKSMTVTYCIALY